MKKLTLALALAPAAVVISLFLASCDDDGFPDKSEFYIDPPQASLSSTDETLVLQAVGGDEPMDWTVSDTSVGTVSGSGRSVTYTRTNKNGVNTVHVLDANHWTATSTIMQQSLTNTTLTISPPSATVTNGESVTFYALGGIGTTYTWALQPPAGGKLSPKTGPITVYTCTNDATDVVSLSDGFATVYAVVIKE